MKHCFPSLFTFFLVLSLISCNKNNDPTLDQKQGGSKLAPDGFNFSTFKSVNISVRLLSNSNEPVKGTLVSIKSPTSGETLLKRLTDADGYVKSSINIPAYIETLIINPNHPGLIQNVRGLIVNNTMTVVIGGTSVLSGDAIKSSYVKGKTLFNNNATVFATTYSYMGTLDNSGRPMSYLEPQKGTVSTNLLSYLSAALPNQQDVRVHHPQFVSDNATEHLNIIQLSDVWITFVAEGAGNLNSIGYYTYQTNNPPASAAEITEVKLLFPNASAVGDGGSLQPGDKVHIGQFPAGTSIGFVLFWWGWQGGNIVHVNNPKFYSDSKFNPESSVLQSHTVLLNYVNENQFIIGFEDVNRTDPSCDHDFNDVILYATSNPVTAISTTGVSTMGPATDTDGDGIYDNNDEFPSDPAKAYTSYYPSKNTWGTLAFEDNWPAKGDYDMNDVVVKYQYSYVHNASNKVVDMSGNYVLENAMASFTNGFGVQLPFAPGVVSSITGQRLTDNYIMFNANGTESGQSKAVIIPFENHKTVLANNATQNGGTKDTVKVKINFTNPIAVSSITGAPYNPFLISDRKRGTEIHLSGYLPTDKADLNLFGTNHDDSNPATNKYYLSSQNWPWALNFLESFSYPKEGAAINEAYLHFGEWATAGGTVFTDWYKNIASTYRDQTKIH